MQIVDNRSNRRLILTNKTIWLDFDNFLMILGGKKFPTQDTIIDGDKNSPWYPIISVESY